VIENLIAVAVIVCMFKMADAPFLNLIPNLRHIERIAGISKAARPLNEIQRIMRQLKLLAQK